MAFSNGQNVQAADLNNFSVTTVTTSGDVTVGDDLLVADDATIGGDLAVTGSLTVNGAEITGSTKNVVGGRLTLTSGTPVTSADVTAATTLYYALYNGDEIGLYTGSAWVALTIAELSIAIPATTNQMYDVFVDYNGGTPALAITAWTNDTTRATSLTRQDGILVKSGAPTQRYVGSFSTTGVSGQTEDSVLKRMLWNLNFQVPRVLRVVDGTNSWNYTTNTWRQANASAANQVTVVVGIAGQPTRLSAVGIASNGVGARMYTGIGEDVTNATHANTVGIVDSATGVEQQNHASLLVNTAIGKHVYAWLEKSEVSGTTTWYGDNGTTDTTSGMDGVVMA